MSNLPSAEMSPRIVNGVIKWYQGDTFDLQLTFDLEDQDGEPITIAQTDTVNIVFKDKSLKTVKEFTFTNISNNTVTMDFDATCTALFGSGIYTYDIYYTGTERTTLGNNNKVVVEE